MICKLGEFWQPYTHVPASTQLSWRLLLQCLQGPLILSFCQSSHLREKLRLQLLCPWVNFAHLCACMCTLVYGVTHFLLSCVWLLLSALCVWGLSILLWILVVLFLLLSSILLYEYTMIVLFILCWWTFRLINSLCLLWIKLIQIFLYI